MDLPPGIEEGVAICRHEIDCASQIDSRHSIVVTNQQGIELDDRFASSPENMNMRWRMVVCKNHDAEPGMANDRGHNAGDSAT
jgi:hypothetical protein